MVRFAVGYRSRAIVTFGRPIPLDGYDPSSRRSVLDLSHLVRAAIGRLYKVLPTALVAAAMRPSITRDRAHRPDRFDSRHAAGDWRECVVEKRRGGRRGRRRAVRGARHPRAWSAAGSACASATCCATTPGPSSTCSRPAGRRTSPIAESRMNFGAAFSFRHSARSENRRRLIAES